MTQRPERSRIATIVLIAGLTWVVMAGIQALAGVNTGGLLDRRVSMKAGCPEVLLGSSNALEDFADEVTWQGRSYVLAEYFEDTETGRSLPKRLPKGRKVLAVNCSLSDPSATRGNRIAPGPWPDGTATGLPHGTVLYAVRGFDTTCVLAAETDERVVAYLAVDIATGSPTGC